MYLPHKLAHFITKSRNFQKNFCIQKIFVFKKSPKTVLYIYPEKVLRTVVSQKTLVTVLFSHTLQYCFLYSTSLCFSSSERFLYRSQPYSCFLFFFDNTWLRKKFICKKTNVKN